MQNLIVLVCVLFIGPLGCAVSLTVNDKFVETGRLNVSRINHVSAENGRISGVCVIANFHTTGVSEYNIRITPSSNSNKCERASPLTPKLCEDNIPVSIVVGSDISPGCKLGKLFKDDTSKLEIHNSEYGIYSHKRKGSDEVISYVDTGNTMYVKASGYHIVYPLAIVLDILLTPIQIPIYLLWDQHPLRRSK